MPEFPPENDLSPGDVAVSTVVNRSTRYQDAADILGALRQSYREQRGDHCDVVLLAVPEGRGWPFVQALHKAVNDE